MRFATRSATKLSILVVIINTCVATSLSGQTPQGAIDCSPGGHGRNCQVHLMSGQITERVSFRPATPILVAAAKPQYMVKQLPDGDVKGPISEQAGIYTYDWSGAGPVRDTVRLLVQAQVGGALQSDTIYIIPSAQPAIAVYVPNYRPYVWLRENWIPLTVRAEIKRVDNRPLDEATCEKIRFAYQPRADGKVTPDSGSAAWEASGVAGRCIAEARWKLSEATGSQQLRVVVGDDERVTRTDQVLTAFAREGPRIIVGVGFFNRYNRDETVYCETPDSPRSDCQDLRFGTDTLKRTFAVRDKDVVQPLFGVEIPIFVTNQPGNDFTSFISKRLRLVAGSTFEKPATNVFVGVTVVPLFSPAYERISAQLHIGWRPRAGGYIIGGSVDGSELVSNALKAFGAPF